jgi:signal transduction histidine kinase
MRFPLRYQILIPTLSIVLLMLAVSTFLSARMAARRTEHDIAQRLRQMGDTLQASAFPLTDSVLKKMRGLSGAEFVLADREGRVLAASRHFDVRLLPPADVANLSDVSFDQDFDAEVTVNAERYFDRVVRITRAGETAPSAWLHMLFSEQDWRQARRDAALPSLLVGAVAIAITVGTSLELSWRVTRPIRRLQSHLGRIAAGEFKPMTLPDRNDEMQDLAVSVNVLAARLEELDQAIRRGERLAILGQLSGGIAHQMRNSITGAKMAIELHQRGCSAHDTECIPVALRQLQLVHEQIQSLLNSGRRRKALPTNLKLETVVGEVERLVAPSARHRRIDLVVEPGNGCSVYGDADQLRQLVLNLALNALEAVSREGRVRIVVDQTPEEVRLRVFDTGPGPPARLAERIFEPFTTGKPEGIGLGLAVARQTAESHDGSLEFYRDRNETCFELRLPKGRIRTELAPSSLALAKLGESSSFTELDEADSLTRR